MACTIQQAGPEFHGRYFLPASAESVLRVSLMNVDPALAHAGHGEGHYQLDTGSHLYVGRGVGTDFLPIRFLSRPEITLLELAPLDGGA